LVTFSSGIHFIAAKLRARVATGEQAN